MYTYNKCQSSQKASSTLRTQSTLKLILMRNDAENFIMLKVHSRGEILSCPVGLYKNDSRIKKKNNKKNKKNNYS